MGDIGNGDPEISDASDVTTYLSERYPPNGLRARFKRLRVCK
jgi:hypothetical protein